MGDGCSETSAARPHSKWHDMVMTEVGSTQSNTQGYHREGAQGPTAQREVAGGGGGSNWGKRASLSEEERMALRHPGAKAPLTAHRPNYQRHHIHWWWEVIRAGRC